TVATISEMKPASVRTDAPSAASSGWTAAKAPAANAIVLVPKTHRISRKTRGALADPSITEIKLPDISQSPTRRLSNDISHGYRGEKTDFMARAGSPAVKSRAIRTYSTPSAA